LYNVNHYAENVHLYQLNTYNMYSTCVDVSIWSCCLLSGSSGAQSNAEDAQTNSTTHPTYFGNINQFHFDLNEPSNDEYYSFTLLARRQLFPLIVGCTWFATLSKSGKFFNLLFLAIIYAYTRLTSSIRIFEYFSNNLYRK